ncbi:serine/threonine-protein kinase [Nannocystis punicea]|uniref:Serine/threonine-protein kinase n=1 Tax=Nannocystis punicea TaxID=2995304 RepID=A0ABY7GYM9_9BACT|nr:serine/threonine-protein kinase [Nannocystis poenicansa]WAS92091.1 serine/threonine-protein kinase [Nannocystis poenicansa]
MLLSTTNADPPSDDTTDPSEVVRIGRYVVLGRQGAGAMGVVYRAYDEALDRKVALKLLRAPGADHSQARARLLREAKALAQLSHPNVVQVYDVGEWGGLDFIALEFVQGQTLRTWLSEQTRSWSEILQVFAQAGRGLAAAHAAGLVHRDFKPENVLIDGQGRVFVADFGLARSADSPVPEQQPPLASRSSPSLARLTAMGSLVGTPKYMAPEQFMRVPADARSDQFSFCVALYEALFGRRPFVGETVDELRQSVLLGKLLPPPVLTMVPQWLQDLTMRGLARDPTRRFPSMDALLAELDRVRGRRLLIAAGVAALGLGVAAFVFTQAAPVCQGAEDKLAGVWDSTRDRELHEAFLATELPFAAQTSSLTRDALDRYASDWKAVHEEACLAHHRGEQSDMVLDLRMSCLQRRRTELAARVEVLTEGVPSTVTFAVDAVRSLPPVAACSDPAELVDEWQRIDAPRHPTAPARVQTLRRKLAHIDALERAGQFQRGLALAEEAVRDAQALDDHPVVAEAHLQRGSLLIASNDIMAAENELWRAIVTATRSDHDDALAKAMVKEVYVLAHAADSFASAERMAERAGALLDRIAPRSRLVGELRNNLAVLRFLQGRHDESEALHHENLQFRRSILPTHDPEIAMTLNNLGVDLQELRRFSEAGELLRESIDAFSDAVGEQHPHTLQSLANLALVQFDSGEYEQARESLTDLLDPWTAILGPDNPNTAEQQCVAGLLDIRDGDVAGGLAKLRRAHELGERRGHSAARYRTRLSYAQALWEHAPDERARALELAHDAENDAIVLRDAHLRSVARDWLSAREHGKAEPKPAGPEPQRGPGGP